MQLEDIGRRNVEAKPGLFPELRGIILVGRELVHVTELAFY